MLPFFTLIPLRLMGVFLIMFGFLTNAWAGDATNAEQQDKVNVRRYTRQELKAVQPSVNPLPKKVIAQLRDAGLLREVAPTLPQKPCKN